MQGTVFFCGSANKILHKAGISNAALTSFCFVAKRISHSLDLVLLNGSEEGRTTQADKDRLAEHWRTEAARSGKGPFGELKFKGYRGLAELPWFDRITQIGLRAQGSARAGEVKDALAYGCDLISAFELHEISEAFSVAAIALRRVLDLDPERINVNGGAVALGHPIGSTGTRIVVSLLYGLAARSGRLGVATLCISGGLGIAALVERVEQVDRGAA